MFYDPELEKFFASLSTYKWMDDECARRALTEEVAIVNHTEYQKGMVGPKYKGLILDTNPFEGTIRWICFYDDRWHEFVRTARHIEKGIAHTDLHRLVGKLASSTMARLNRILTLDPLPSTDDAMFEYINDLEAREKTGLNKLKDNEKELLLQRNELAEMTAANLHLTNEKKYLSEVNAAYETEIARLRSERDDLVDKTEERDLLVKGMIETRKKAWWEIFGN